MAIYLLERERAADAWQAVKSVRETNDQDREGRYRSQVRGAPAMIQRNGLGQFFAFLAGKGFEKGTQMKKGAAEEANARLYQHLGCWLMQRVTGVRPKPEAVVPGGSPTSDPLTWLLRPECGLEQLMHATHEALAWLQWARRFAESQLRTSNKENEDE